AVRKAVRSSTAPHTLLFMLPEATASLAKQVAAGLLVGNHAHRNGRGVLPRDEVRPLFDGDLLLVTSAVSECKDELENLAIGKTLRLRDVWQVLPFSKYPRSDAQKPRIFVANPGWILKGGSIGRF